MNVLASVGAYPNALTDVMKSIRPSFHLLQVKGHKQELCVRERGTELPLREREKREIYGKTHRWSFELMQNDCHDVQ